VYATVAIPKSAPNALTYSVPVELEGFTVPGVRVRVPLRKKTVTGVVVDIKASTDLDPKTIRSLIEVVDPEPLLPPHLFYLADFVASYYRCPLGDTLATILPAGLLRADGEMARLTPVGAATESESIPGKRGAVLSELQAATKLRVPTLLARAGATGRGPLDALVEAGLATVSSSRRDRSPEAEVAAVKLPDVPIEQLLEQCKRAPRRREILEWLSEQGRPALVAEVCAEVGCSPSTLRAMDAAGLVLRFKQPAPRRQRWVLKPDGGRHVLTDEQQKVVDAVGGALAENASKRFWRVAGVVSCWCRRSVSRPPPRARSSGDSGRRPRSSIPPSPRAIVGGSGVEFAKAGQRSSSAPGPHSSRRSKTSV